MGFECYFVSLVRSTEKMQKNNIFQKVAELCQEKPGSALAALSPLEGIISPKASFLLPRLPGFAEGLLSPQYLRTLLPDTDPQSLCFCSPRVCALQEGCNPFVSPEGAQVPFTCPKGTVMAVSIHIFPAPSLALSAHGDDAHNVF